MLASLSSDDAKILARCHASLRLAYNRQEVALDDIANVVDLSRDEQRAALEKVLAGKANTLTAAARGRKKGSGVSLKSKTIRVRIEAEAVVMADTIPLGVNMIVERLKGLVDRYNCISAAMPGKPFLKVEFCSRPGCGAAILEGDARIQGTYGVQCRECPDGK